MVSNGANGFWRLGHTRFASDWTLVVCVDDSLWLKFAHVQLSCYRDEWVVVTPPRRLVVVRLAVAGVTVADGSGVLVANGAVAAVVVTLALPMAGAVAVGLSVAAMVALL